MSKKHSKTIIWYNTTTIMDRQQYEHQWYILLNCIYYIKINEGYSCCFWFNAYPVFKCIFSVSPFHYHIQTCSKTYCSCQFGNQYRKCSKRVNDPLVVGNSVSLSLILLWKPRKATTGSFYHDISMRCFCPSTFLPSLWWLLWVKHFGG